MGFTKTSRVLLASAARTANTQSPVFTDMDAAALRLYLNVTVVSGTGGIYPVIRGYDKVSGNAVELTSGGDVVNETGTYAYEMSTAADPAFGAIRESVSRTVPDQWDVLVKQVDGTSYTYSLSAEVCR